ncbi:hypothetical protein GCM10010532_096170 [Dactylosporangium siamense]|uniref:Uncharacterized protein n=2 Tax=Dactylosporangium siamense TaxID=685454 RepID=A0A919PTG8_9ACTN|nr:hypothetical protein Dsi01nite_079530 [Dactylosporangium siamense]
MRLVHLGHVFINFKNNTFQWVGIQRFRLPGPTVNDTSVLAMLISHELYGDDHAGGTPGDNPERHGPYWRDRITPGCFDLTDAGGEERLLRAWAEQHAPLPEHLHADLGRDLYQPLRAAKRVYRLRDLGPAAYHDWGGVQTEFHELALIDHTDETLTVVVAADD